MPLQIAMWKHVIANPGISFDELCAAMDRRGHWFVRSRADGILQYLVDRRLVKSTDMYGLGDVPVRMHGYFWPRTGA